MAAKSDQGMDAEPVLGDVLRLARKRRKLTLRDVEERTGIPNAHLSQIERGQIQRPDQQLVWRLSQLYELDFGLLLDWTGSKNKTSEQGSAYFATAIRLLSNLGEKDLEEAAQYLEALNRRQRSGGAEP
jgi:transcriptional regulator with XRE-family HTH domain